MATTTETRWLPVLKFHKLHPEAGALNYLYELCRQGVLRSCRLGKTGKILIAENALDILAEEQRSQAAVGE